MDTIGLYLKNSRKRQNLTLRTVQEMTGISNAYLSQLENGKIKKPSPSILHKLSECYHLSYEYLLELTGYPSPNNRLASSELKSKTGNWINELTEEEEEKLKEYLDFLRSRKGR